MPDYSTFPPEAEYERLVEEEKPVYSVYWDSGAPGAGADSEHVYRWGAGYIVLFSDGEDETVYPSLREAVEKTDLNYVTEATQEIHSPEMSSEEIAGLLRTDGEGSRRVLINGETWQTEGSGGFRMENTEHISLSERLDALLEDSSMPEIVAALVLLSRGYAEQLRSEGNPEYPGWETWEHALSAALLEVEGPEEFNDLLNSP